MGEAIVLGLSSYDRSDLPPVSLRNMYYEKAPTNLEDQVALIPRPRLKSFAITHADGTLGAGPMMGLYREGGVIGGAIVALAGDKLFTVTQAGVPGTGTATLIGTVEGSGLRMTAEGNLSTVVLTCGTKLYQTNGASISQITMPDNRNAFAVDTLNNYFLVASDVGRFYWSAVGGTSIDPLDYATAESQPDGLMTLKVLGDELWLVGRLSVEVWQPTGDLDLPFQRIDGRVFGIGITARDTCQKVNVGGVDKMIWLGTDRRVYWTNPNPEQISDAALDELLRGIELSITDNSVNPYACVYPWEGHDFYVLHIPGHGSKVFDLKTGRWSDADSYGSDFFRVGVSAIGPNNQPLLGDDTTNRIWELTTATKTDGEDPVTFEFSGLVEVPGAPVRCNNVMLDVTTGSASTTDEDPTIALYVSDDMGQTWDDPEVEHLGRQGQRDTRVMWARLGQMINPGRIFRWRTAEPVTVRKAKYNESYRR